MKGQPKASYPKTVLAHVGVDGVVEVNYVDVPAPINEESCEKSKMGKSY